MGQVEFRRNKETGIIETYRDGQYVGSVITMGDQIISVVPIMPGLSNKTDKLMGARYNCKKYYLARKTVVV